MATRVAINGFGRVGRAAFRSAFERELEVEWVGINDVELETRRRLIAGRNSDVSFTVARSQQKKSDDRKWAQHAVNLESIQAARQEAGGGMSGRRRWPVRETRALSGPCLGG